MRHNQVNKQVIGNHFAQSLTILPARALPNQVSKQAIGTCCAEPLTALLARMLRFQVNKQAIGTCCAQPLTRLPARVRHNRVNEQATEKRFAQPLTMLPTQIRPYAEETLYAVSSFLPVPRSTYQYRVNVSAQPRCAADAAGAARTWARFTRQTAAISWRGSATAFLQRLRSTPSNSAFQRAIAAVCWRVSRSRPVPLLTPASGAADSYPLGRHAARSNL